MEWNQLLNGDCVEGLAGLEPGTVDLAFADPPFNIGYDYDVYDDRSDAEHYLDWTRAWGRAVQRVLKPTGTFWLAIGDEFAAELKLIFQKELGFTCRSWVIWYYTFGVNCTRKFSRSHTHLFHFVKDPKHFTFNDDGHPRALGPPAGLRRRPRRPGRPPAGRHLDPAAAGFARRLPARRGHLVLPPRLRHLQGARRLARLPDAGATPGPDHQGLLQPRRTGARPLRRQRHDAGRRQETRPAWLGFELSPNYAAKTQARLDAAQEGQPLEGAEDPRVSAPSTANGKRRKEPRREAVADALRIRFGEDAKAAILPLLEHIEDAERLRELHALAIRCASPDEFRAGLDAGPAPAGTPRRRATRARKGKQLTRDSWLFG